MNLRQALYGWRDNEAVKRGVELFRILPNTALDEIVKAMPRTKEELTAIKGIKDAKYHAYGQTIFSLVEEYGGFNPTVSDETKGDSMGRIGMLTEDDKRMTPVQQTFYSVSQYLDIVNAALWRFSARVRGEITSWKAQGSAVYFTIKDSSDDSLLNVFMWLRDYDASGITVEEDEGIGCSCPYRVTEPKHWLQVCEARHG